MAPLGIRSVHLIYYIKKMKWKKSKYKTILFLLVEIIHKSLDCKNVTGKKKMFVSHAESKRIKVEIFGLKTKKQLEVWIEKM